MENLMKKMNTNEPELNTKVLEKVTGGTPMSIPGGKRSGRKTTETALEITKSIGDWANDLLESIDLKEKRVDNRIYDRTITLD